MLESFAVFVIYVMVFNLNNLFFNWFDLKSCYFSTDVSSLAISSPLLMTFYTCFIS